MLQKVAQENASVVIPSIITRFPERDIRTSELVQKVSNLEQVEHELKMEIQVWNLDTVEAAYLLREENPLVLNMASEYTPGGGYLKGSKAQEEDLCRKTSLYPSLHRHYYPLKKYQCIYSPHVLAFRDPSYKLVKWKKCSWMSVVSMAAVRKPKLVQGKYTKEDHKIMKLKIRKLLTIALLKGHKTLVLGAWGCGVFGNPPRQVALLFKTVLAEFEHSFQKVVFAIIDGSRSNNFEIFNKVFSY